MHELIKNQKINTFRAFDLIFTNTNISSCSYIFFSTIALQFLITAVIAQLLNPAAELAIPIGIPANEAHTGLKTHPVITETKINESSM